MVVVPGRIKLAPERDDFRVVDIEPVHALWRIDAKKAGVEPAPKMQHDGVGISGQKVPNADIQRLGLDGKADTEIVVDLEPGKIIIDLAHRRVSEVILEQRMGQPAIQGLAVERHQQGLSHSGQSCLFHSHAYAPSVAADSIWVWSKGRQVSGGGKASEERYSRSRRYCHERSDDHEYPDETVSDPPERHHPRR